MSENEVKDSDKIEEPIEQIEDNQDQDDQIEDSSSESTESEAAQEKDYGKAFAAVKKKYREKGRQEGLAEAKKLLESQNEEENTVVDPVYQSSSSNAVQTDAVWLNRCKAIEAEGKAKYDDFATQIDAALRKASNNPTLTHLYQYAISVGNADILYDLMTNSKKRSKMLEDINCWDKELFNLQKSDSKKTVKTPPEPIKELKGSPAKGKRSFDEQRRYIIEKYG